MGSWYATCGISGLPIRSRTPAYLVLLTQGKDQHPQLENDTHEKPSLYSGTLMHKHPLYWGKEAPLGHVLVRADVWDALLVMPIRDWFGESRTVEVTRSSVLPWLDFIVSSTEEIAAAKESKDQKQLSKAFVNQHMVFGGHCLDPRRGEFTACLGRGEFSWFNFLFSRVLEEGDASIEDLREAALKMADLIHISFAFDILRKIWAPGTSRGSQTYHIEEQIGFHEMVIATAIADKKEWDEY